MSDYWAEALSEALISEGLEGVISVEKINKIGEILEVSHDNYGMSRGYDCIPNPLEAEVKRVEQYRERDQKEAEERLRRREAELESQIRSLQYRINDLERELRNGR